MDLVKFEDKHYNDISPWFAQYGWNAPSLQVLPRTGFIALSNGIPVSAGFYYTTNSGMVFMDWIIGDKNALPVDRKNGVKTVLDAIISTSKESGFSVLYTVTSNSYLINVYKNMGLSEMEVGATTMAISLDGTNQEFLR